MCESVCDLACVCAYVCACVCARVRLHALVLECACVRNSFVCVYMHVRACVRSYARELVPVFRACVCLCLFEFVCALVRVCLRA
jgi:hypothetical protein